MDKETKLLLEDLGRNWEQFKENYNSTKAEFGDRLDLMEGCLDGVSTAATGLSRDSQASQGLGQLHAYRRHLGA